MTRRVCVVLAVGLAVAVAIGSLRAQSVQADAGASSAPLEEIRLDLEQLRFEKALSSIEAYLADPQLSREQRIAALILRSHAHVSYGDLDSAENDYRELLMLRPAYVPEESLTPQKAMSRFAKARGELVGSVTLTLEPPDAVIRVDDREVVVPQDGVLTLVAGSRVLRAERPGFDAEEYTVEVPPGEGVDFRVHLIPNSRTVVIRTRPEGVRVAVDGQPVGVTAIPSDRTTTGSGVAELVVEHLPLGEHTFELAKECFRSAVYQDIVTVDLTDYSPKLYKPMVLEPARSRLSLRGALDGAEIRVDGHRVAVAPAADVEVCPGERTVAVRMLGRTVWQSRELFALDESLEVRIRPRPNVVRIGAEDWPPGLRAWVAGLNDLGRVREPGRSSSTRVDLTDPETWKRVELPDDADLAVAIVPPRAEGSSPRWLLYSPLLRSVHRFDGVDLDPGAPSWTETTVGVQLVDSDVGGRALVAVVIAGAPAAAAGVRSGERVVAVDTRSVEGAAEASRLIAEHSARGPVVLQIEAPSGERRDVEIAGVESPRLIVLDERAGPATAWVAAWANADGAAGGAGVVSTSFANLALLLEQAGRPAAAVEAWRRVRWGKRAGVGQGTAAYYAARALEALDREKESIEAYREASASASTVFGDDGPSVAPAADDHLADLGVTAERPTAR